MRKKFFRCGILGWCLEIIWTGFLAFRRREMKLFGRTSIWMFPIYGLAGIFIPLFQKLYRFPALIRGTFYTAGIFFVEFLTGTWLKKKDCCPWDYSKAKYNLKGVVRLDYAPLWFFTGLFMEKQLKTGRDTK